MALLGGLIRTVAITGRTDTTNAWFAGRQGGRWAEQTIRDLHQRGVLTDDEFDSLRAGRANPLGEARC